MSEEPLKNEFATADQTRPVGLDLDLKSQVLRIKWADRVESVLHAPFLRRHCPCATCRTDREKQGKTLLPILSASQSGQPTLTGGHLVGNYALQLEWSDGHSTGIYEFRLLRSLHGGR